MIIRIKMAFVLMLISSLCSGCVFNLGESQGYCEENGCNYADAGVCGDTFDIYKKRYNNIEKSYENIECDCKGKKQ